LNNKDTPEVEEDIKIKDVTPEKEEVKEGIPEKEMQAQVKADGTAEMEKEVKIHVTEEKEKDKTLASKAMETQEKGVTTVEMKVVVVGSPKENTDKEGKEKTQEKMEEKDLPNKNG